MIKIITPEESKKIYRVQCNHCRTTIEYNEEDTQIGALGLCYLNCPKCGKELDLYEPDGIVLDENNIKFPQHFFRYGEHNNAVDIGDEEISKWVSDCIKQLKNSGPDDYVSYAGSGNTLVCAMRFEGDGVIQVIVAKNYWDTEVPLDCE